VRSFWYRIQRGSGSVAGGSVTNDSGSVAVWQCGSVAVWQCGSVARGVAVVGWQWHESIEEISAVILVLNSCGSGGYWRGGSGFCRGREFL
jgi:hypothetical protein